MNPYDLMLELRQNRILFQYMEHNSVCCDDKGWVINGESEEGQLFIYNTTSNLLRFVMPIPVPKEIPPEALGKIVAGIQERIEGLLVINYETVSIEYFIHATPYDAEGLDASLIKFCQERGDIKKGLNSVAESVKQIMKSMNLEQVLKGPYPSSGSSNKASAPNSSLWDTMSDLEKNAEDSGNINLSPDISIDSSILDTDELQDPDGDDHNMA